MSKRLCSWSGRHLSIGGRVSLINSVLASLLLYFFSFFKAHICVIIQLIRIQRNFLWGGGLEDKKLCWVSWEQVCLPKKRGGLGIKDLKLFNLALLCKWKWRCITDNEAMWFDLLQFRYGHNISSLMHHENNYVGRNDSLWWRDLMRVGCPGDANWFSSNIWCVMGNGKRISFWKEKWLGTTTFCELFPGLFSKETHKTTSIADKLTRTGHGLRWVWEWSEELAGDEHCNLVVLDADTITTVHKLWKNDIPSKVGVFGWRLLQDKLPTRAALASKGIITNSHALVGERIYAWMGVHIRSRDV
ncbi:ribonuclease H protein, partial [Trifolium medium]|nr:ribonuclease H protein [Trifolium medium]